MTCRILFWNIYGFNNIFDLSNAPLTNDILCFSETWLCHSRFSHCSLARVYNFVDFKASRDFSRGHASGGLCVAIPKCYKILEVIRSEFRWIFVRVQIYDCCVIVGNLYILPGTELSTLASSLSDLSQLLGEISLKYPQDILILGGDFNCATGVLNEVEPAVIPPRSPFYATRTSLDHLPKDRGEILVSCLEDNGLLILNGRSPSDRPAAFTHIPFQSKFAESVIDYICVHSNSLCVCTDFYVEPLSSHSDHLPIVLELSLTPNSPVLSQIHIPQYNPYKWKNNSALTYQENMRISHRTMWNPNASINECYNNLNSAMVESIQKTKLLNNSCVNAPPIRRQEWFDDDCKRIQSSMLLALHQWQKSKTPQHKAAYQKLRASSKKYFECKKITFENNLRLQLQDVHDSASFWRVINKYRRAAKCSNEIKKELREDVLR